MRPALVVEQLHERRPDVLEQIGLEHQLERARGRSHRAGACRAPRPGARGCSGRCRAAHSSSAAQVSASIVKSRRAANLIARRSCAPGPRGSAPPGRRSCGSARIEVGHAIDEVEDAARARVVEQPVDREVAPARVLVRRCPTRCRAVISRSSPSSASLALARVGAERAGLDDLRAEEDVGELEAPADDAAVAEQPPDLSGVALVATSKSLGLRPR